MKLLRLNWIFNHRYIVSDCDSAEVIHDAQKWLGDTQEDTVAQVLKAGKTLLLQILVAFEV